MLLPVVHETSGLLFVDKPAGLAFHRSVDQGDEGVLPLLRDMQASGALAHPGRLHSVHRLDRVTSGLLTVAKTAEAAREVAELLRGRRVVKYYVALSGRRPSKKQGRVRGDMARSRRGQWKLLRTAENPALTAFTSVGLPPPPPPGAGRDASPSLRAFLLRPHTGRTHQLRVAMKSLGSPVLGDPMYAAADVAGREERAYLHSAALRLPGSAALCDDGARTIEVRCRPTRGAHFASAAFERQWLEWFGPAGAGGDGAAEGAVWFAGTAVSSEAPS